MEILDEPIDESQADYWTSIWQDAEREADRDLAEGRIEAFDFVDDLMNALNQHRE